MADQMPPLDNGSGRLFGCFLALINLAAISAVLVPIIWYLKHR